MTATGASLAGHAAPLAAQADRVALCLDFDGTLSRSWTTRRRLGRYRASSSCTGPGRPIRRRRPHRGPPGHLPDRARRGA
jgi:hypothetical protein